MSRNEELLIILNKEYGDGMTHGRCYVRMLTDSCLPWHLCQV
jgi:hypothetical protein